MPAQYNLGFMYANGQGVPEDYVEAVKWYRKAADQGDASAQYNLGRMVASGQGVRQDYVEAVKWYRKAADQGDASACFNLGLMYSNGQGTAGLRRGGEVVSKGGGSGGCARPVQSGPNVRIGTKRAAGPRRGGELVPEGGGSGDASAQFNLGLMYGMGQGVPKDYVLSHMWFTLTPSRFSASEQERRDMAGSNRDIAASKMTPAQVAEAEKLAREWKPKRRR